MKRVLIFIGIAILLTVNSFATEVNWTPYQEEEELFLWSTSIDSNIELAMLETTGTLVFWFEDTKGNGVTVSLDEVVRVLNELAKQFGITLVELIK